MTETAAAHLVDWASFEYGSAVPRLLDRLAGGDPSASRDLCRIAPDGVDVRPWVVAALPTLLDLVADPARHDRAGVLRLIGDLAGADRTWYHAGETLRAKQLLAEHLGAAELLADGDPGVRDAAAYTVRALSRLTPELAELLWERYVDEPDPGVRLTLMCSAVIVGAVGSGLEPTKIWLAWVADSDADLRVRITALTELMTLGDPPPFDPDTASETLLEAYRDGTGLEPAPPVDDVVAPLLAGWQTEPRTPGFRRVVGAVRAGYRNDTRPQLDLLQRMLALETPEAWHDALLEGRPLMQRLRGHYRPLVLRAAELLQDRDARVRAAALRLLGDIGEIGRPAADAVWVALSRTEMRVRQRARQNGHLAWLLEDGSLGPAVRMLAELRDPRVLPALERLLDEAPETTDLHRLIAGYGMGGRGLSRTLRRRLRSDFQMYGYALLFALTAVAPNEAGDHLAGVPVSVAGLDLLTRSGRAASARIPDIREALTIGNPALELAAAHAIWAVAGDAAAAAEVYDRYFDDRRATAEHAVAAIDGLGELGIRVASLERRLLKRMNRRAGAAVLVATADALWRVAGSKEAARTLGRVWEAEPQLRPRIAGVWLRSGNAAYGTRFARAELEATIRHNVSGYGLSPAEVTEDERLLSLCREITAS
ncbi:hypothetical protein AB0M02_39205 [Actinoplanes sp. NPDC051861]|uniref:hypothetical protein n=1 Tax=Actinoplanes sp. NPDC051861 TaxID=3155170 RepID=UPI003434FD4A